MNSIPLPSSGIKHPAYNETNVYRKNGYSNRHIPLMIAIFVLAGILSYAQSDVEMNILKYKHYRQRFIDNFISIGPAPGESLPFTSRNDEGKPLLNQGEGEIILGHYIGMLATEYALLKKNNADTSETIKELYYALYAFNRLDLIAETVNGYGKKPELNGFFVREDFPDDFIETHPGLNAHSTHRKDYIPHKGIPLDVKCTNHKGRWDCHKSIDKNCKVTTYRHKGYSDKYEHAVMSFDQMLGMLLGTSLVNKLLDEQVTYLNRPFQDGENSLKKEARNIARRIISYAAKYHWTPKEPDGNYPGDCKFTGNSRPNYLKNNATISYFARYVAQIGKNIFGSEYGYFPLIDVLGGFFSIQLDNIQQSFYHRRMFIEMMCLSNRDNHLFRKTSKKVLLASKKYNWQSFYYALGMVLHHWKPIPGLKRESLNILGNAPYEGPFFHGMNDLASGGWASDSKWSSSLGAQYFGSRFPEATGNYAGMDYMLFHNLFLLAYQQKSPSYKNILSKSKKKYIQPPIHPVQVKKCVRAGKQICKERVNYYRFLKQITLKNCHDTREKCQQKLNGLYRRKFGKDFDIHKATDCSKQKLLRMCQYHSNTVNIRPFPQ